MADDVVLETARLRLRNWREGDSRRFYDIMNTPAVMENLGGVQTFEKWSEAHERLQGYARDFGHTFWIVETHDGEMQGFCGLKTINYQGAGPLTGTPEIGWRLRESAWGKGYAKEAAMASLDHGFEHVGYERICAITVASNVPSWGLMERLSMRRTPEWDYEDPTFSPTYGTIMVWIMDKADWPTARAKALAPKA